MPTFPCPSCGRQLRVSDDLVGRTVRCPNCKATFQAEAGDVSASAFETVEDEDRPRLPRGEGDEERPRRRSRPAPPREEEDDDLRAHYGDDQGDEDEDSYRPGGRKRRRAAAREALAGPAMSLMVISGILIGLCTILLFIHLLGVALIPAQGQQGGPGQANQAEFTVGLVTNTVAVIIGLCWWSIVFLGALKMKHVRGYGYAMTATIMSILPCTPCCVVTCPIGIWALMVLLRPEVKGAF